MVFKVIPLPGGPIVSSAAAQGLITAHFISGGKLRVKAKLSLTASVSLHTHTATDTCTAIHRTNTDTIADVKSFKTAFMIQINHVFVTFFSLISFVFYLPSLPLLSFAPILSLIQQIVLYLCSFSTPGQKACDLYVIKINLTDILYLLTS